MIAHLTRDERNRQRGKNAMTPGSSGSLAHLGSIERESCQGSSSGYVTGVATRWGWQNMWHLDFILGDKTLKDFNHKSDIIKTYMTEWHYQWAGDP